MKALQELIEFQNETYENMKKLHDGREKKGPS